MGQMVICRSSCFKMGCGLNVCVSPISCGEVLTPPYGCVCDGTWGRKDKWGPWMPLYDSCSVLIRRSNRTNSVSPYPSFSVSFNVAMYSLMNFVIQFIISTYQNYYFVAESDSCVSVGNLLEPVTVALGHKKLFFVDLLRWAQHPNTCHFYCGILLQIHDLFEHFGHFSEYYLELEFCLR